MIGLSNSVLSPQKIRIGLVQSLFIQILCCDRLCVQFRNQLDQCSQYESYFELNPSTIVSFLTDLVKTSMHGYLLLENSNTTTEAIVKLRRTTNVNNSKGMRYSEILPEAQLNHYSSKDSFLIDVESNNNSLSWSELLQ
jgi:hypothetical protein